MGRNLGGKSSIKNIAAAPPTRRVVDEDGIVTEGGVNPMQAKRKMVHPDGCIADISLATGWTTKLSSPGYGLASFNNNPYGALILTEKIAKGFLPFDECPIAKGYVPAKEGETGCTTAPPAGECCQHLLRIIKARRAVESKKQEGFRKQMMSSNDKIVEFARQQMAGSATAPTPAPESSRGKMPRSG